MPTVRYITFTLSYWQPGMKWHSGFCLISEDIKRILARFHLLPQSTKTLIFILETPKRQAGTDHGAPYEMTFTPGKPI